MNETITIQRIETERHGYFKVPLNILDEMNIINIMSGYSYLGNRSGPLNEEHFAYLEEDTDFGYFDKAMKHFNRSYEVDSDTLTDLYNENYDHYRDWLDELFNWDIEFICDQLGYICDDPNEELMEAIDPDIDEDDYYEDEEEDDEE
jgi:hypothetical protein